MLRLSFFIAALALFGFTFSGCNRSADDATTPGEHVHSEGDGHEHGEAGHGHQHGDEEAESGEYAEEFAKLPEADRELARKQKVCPVSDQPLGSMGVPVKITVKDQTVFLCCAGCEDAIKAEPDKYLAKLNK